jgi:hypothetical protein
VDIAEGLLGQHSPQLFSLRYKPIYHLHAQDSHKQFQPHWCLQLFDAAHLNHFQRALDMLQPAFNQGRTLTTGDLFTRQLLEKGKKKKKKRAKEDRTSYTPSNTTAASVESAER